MYREIRNFGKILEVLLTILNLINLLLLASIFASVGASDFYPQVPIVRFVQAPVFTSIVFIVNGLTYLLSIFYIIDTYQQGRNKFVKLSFCVFSILTSVLCFIMISNLILSIWA